MRGWGHGWRTLLTRADHLPLPASYSLRGDTTLIGDAPEGASNVSEASYGSTEQETGTNEPEGPDSGRGTSTQVRFVKRCLYSFEIILFYENSKK